MRFKISDQCAISLEKIKDGDFDVYTLEGCGHQFHLEGIREWLRTNNSCPLCKQTRNVNLLPTTVNIEYEKNCRENIESEYGKINEFKWNVLWAKGLGCCEQITQIIENTPSNTINSIVGQVSHELIEQVSDVRLLIGYEIEEFDEYQPFTLYDVFNEVQFPFTEEEMEQERRKDDRITDMLTEPIERLKIRNVNQSINQSVLTLLTSLITKIDGWEEQTIDAIVQGIISEWD